MQTNRLMSVATPLFTVCIVASVCLCGIAEAQAATVDEPVRFCDPKLKAAVEEQLGVTDPTPRDMLSLTYLPAQGLGITCLEGIEYATDIRTLYLGENRLADISALARLTNLTILQVHQNQIKDISPLAELRNLTELDLFDNEISDIVPLVQLTNLTDLSLDGNQINDISSLGELVNLKNLSVTTNNIADISALKGLTNIERLYLQENSIVDISALANLSKLQVLYLDYNPIEHIALLPGLNSLEVLWAAHCQLVDISGVMVLTNLEDLLLNSNQITSISAVSGLKNLKRLRVDGNRITDISPVARLSNLEDLGLGSNQIIDCGPVTGVTKLTRLQLYGNRISDITALSGLTNLEDLRLSSNQIRDISPLSQLTCLRVLDIRYNPLNCDAYHIYIPRIQHSNPVVTLSFDPRPASCDPPPPVGNTFYVDCRANGADSGSSWTDAFSPLQDALRAATYGDEIRVAQGIYTPDRGIGISRGDRYATFHLKNGVAVIGGYAGVTGSDPNVRDIDQFETVLSGDLGGNDVVGQCGDPFMNENSLHVVVGDYTDGTAELDGFIIRGGMANAGSEWRGAGIQIRWGSLTIRRCTFAHNYAGMDGGGLASYNGQNIAGPRLIDCIFTDNYADQTGGAIYAGGRYLTLENCSIAGNSAGSAGGGIWGTNLKLIGCVLADNHAERSGAVELEGNRNSIREYPPFPPELVLDTLAILTNEPDTGKVEDVYALLEGDLSLTYGRLNIISSVLAGDGRITLGREAQLRFTGDWRYEPITTVRASIYGPGLIEIDAGQQLIIEDHALVNLSSSRGRVSDPNRNGRIVVNGSLVIQGHATIESTNIDVKLLDVDDPSVIQYNNIRLLEASTGFGGEFYVRGNARIRNNNIVSEGDRYLDLDPRPDDVNHPAIENNRIAVVIKEGKLGNQGTLLELRAKDYDSGTAVNPVGSSGAYQVPITSPGFTKDPSANWVLEELVLEPNSKLNLTNRQGFEFQGFGELHPETVYVKELVMGPNSVLNTALQTMYYQRLVDPNGVELTRDPDAPYAPLTNGARFEDIPILGFSLGIIAMNDPVEFEVRVRKRLTDPADDPGQPPAPAESLYIGSIERIDAGTNPSVPVAAGGVMEMCTQAPSRQSARSVAAKGAFARAGDEDITVEFEYMFQSHPDPNTELIIYLSDHPEVSKGTSIQVATIRPPDLGRPGSAESGQFTLFSGVFSRGELDFHRGTYVELKLRGRDACCWIDNWDPQIDCGAPKCGDYNNDTQVNVKDYLMLLAEFGPSDSNHPSRGCLDLVRDGCVGIDDLLVWDGSVLNVCPRGSSPAPLASAAGYQGSSSFAAASIDAPRSSPLVVFGKSADTTDWLSHLPSQLYHLDLEGLCSGSDSSAGNGRLIVDGQGTIYQVCNGRGIVRTDTALTALPERQDVMPIASGSLVSIGYDPVRNRGLPLLDAAFKRDDSRTVYVVPVQVTGSTNTGSYPAAAKVRLSSAVSGGYTVEALYGWDPAADPNQKNEPNEAYCKHIVREPDMQHLREVEVDDRGRVYVLSSLMSQSGNTISKNSWILIYDATKPDKRQAISLASVNLLGPTAMVVSKTGDRLYLTSMDTASDVDPNGPTTKVYSFSIVALANERLDLELDCTLTIVGPKPDVTFGNYGDLIEPDRFVCVITSMTEDPKEGTLYATGFTAPKFNEEKWNQTVGVFTVPLLAQIPKEAAGVIHARRIDDPNPNRPLLLPLSMVWTGGDRAIVLAGDRNAQMALAVGLNDLNDLAQSWLESDVISMDARCVYSAGSHR